jgi:adenylate kinase
MKSKIVFIGGIHGVGKGTICNKISSSVKITHLIASELIKWNEISPDEKNKKVISIDDTQERLFKGLSNVLKDDEKYLLDGHLCLLNSMNQPVRVSKDTFVKINPKIISVVIEDVAVIVKRLFKRDGKEYDHDLLDRLQKMEETFALELASDFKIPFIKMDNGDPEDLIQLIKRMD